VRKCSAPGVCIDGGGLRLRVQSSGSRAWIMRIAIRGIARDIGLGPLAVLSLAEARAKANDIRPAVNEGRDPVAERRSEGRTVERNRRDLTAMDPSGAPHEGEDRTGRANLH